MPRKNILTLIIFLAVFGLGFFTFSAPAQAQEAPSIISPTPGSTLTGSSQEFTWNTNGTAVTAWYLWAGPCDSAILNSCGDDYYNSGLSTGTTLTKTATNLPVDGSTVHIRLWYKVGTAWQSELFTYTAHTAAVEKKNYYIATAAEGGSDSNPCSLNSPCATIKYASEKLVAGDTLYVRGGTYFNQGTSESGNSIYNGPAGTADKPITIKSYSNEIAIFDGRGHGYPDWDTPGQPFEQCPNPDSTTNPKPYPDGSAYAAFILDKPFHQHLIIDGFTFQYYKGSVINIAAKYLSAPSHITIQNNIIRDTRQACTAGHGIYLAGYNNMMPNNIIIRNNYFKTPNHGWSIHTYHGPVSAKNVDIYNNIFDSSHVGVILGDGPEDIYLHNNIFYNNSLTGLQVGWGQDGDQIPSNVTIKNNIFYLTGSQLGFSVIAGATVSSDNNDFYVNDTANLSWWKGAYTDDLISHQAVSGQDLNSISINPSFVNPSNPLGPDGKLWTADDGFKSEGSSPGCIVGIDGNYIGAYSCGNPADVNGDGKVNIKDIQACIKVITRSDLTYENQCRVLAPPTDKANIKDIQIIIREVIR